MCALAQSILHEVVQYQISKAALYSSCVAPDFAEPEYYPWTGENEKKNGTMRMKCNGQSMNMKMVPRAMSIKLMGGAMSMKLMGKAVSMKLTGRAMSMKLMGGAMNWNKIQLIQII